MNLSSDTSLIALIKVDNHVAYTALVDKYWADLYRHIWQKIKNSDEAEDIVQDIFLGLWKNRTKIITDERDSIAPYLFRAAKYAIINYFSRPGITITNENALYAAINAPSEIRTDDPLLLKELQQLVESEVNNLPERLQIPYRLSREQELTIREIALKLSMSEQTVKNNISSALGKIRFRLGKHNSDTTISFILALASLLHHK